MWTSNIYKIYKWKNFRYININKININLLKTYLSIVFGCFLFKFCLSTAFCSSAFGSLFRNWPIYST